MNQMSALLLKEWSRTIVQTKVATTKLVIETFSDELFRSRCNPTLKTAHTLAKA